MTKRREKHKIISAIDEELKLFRHRLISITGGGGKTSLLFTLGRYFGNKERTAITTTTKIFLPALNECQEYFIGSAENFIKSASELPNCYLSAAAKNQSEGKMIGYSPEEIDSITESGIISKLIVESDGSRGLSLKGYEDWEPPVASLTECQIIVLGADAFTIPMSSLTVFRFDLLSEKYGIRQGELLSEVNCAAILSNDNGYLKNSPENSYRILFINKGELLSKAERDKLSEKLAGELKGYDALVTGSISSDTIYDIQNIKRI